MSSRVSVLVETCLDIDIEDGVDLDEVIVDMDMDFASTTNGAEIATWSNRHHEVEAANVNRPNEGDVDDESEETDDMEEDDKECLCKEADDDNVIRFKLQIKIAGPSEFLDRAEEILMSSTHRFYKFKRTDDTIKVKLYTTDESGAALVSTLEALEETLTDDTMHYVIDEWK